MRRWLLGLGVAVVVVACGAAPTVPDECAGRPRTDEGAVWSRPRPHPDGTLWNVTFLIPPCHWRTVQDTVVRCAAVNTTRCFPHNPYTP